jgi:hypothetical protein
LYKAFTGFSWSVNFLTLFNPDLNLGLVGDYKILRGTSSNGSVDSFNRVLHTFVVKRPLNYKNSSWVDLKSVTVRFAKRRVASNRKVFGSFKKRFFI